MNRYDFLNEEYQEEESKELEQFSFEKDLNEENSFKPINLQLGDELLISLVYTHKEESIISADTHFVNKKGAFRCMGAQGTCCSKYGKSVKRYGALVYDYIEKSIRPWFFTKRVYGLLLNMIDQDIILRREHINTFVLYLLEKAGDAQWRRWFNMEQIQKEADIFRPFLRKYLARDFDNEPI